MRADPELAATPRQQVPPAALLVNAGSRRGSFGFEAAVASVQREGLRLVDAAALEEPSEVARWVRGALAKGARRIVVGGGDGTLSAAAAELLSGHAELAVLPMGTCNDFARSLRIPLDLEEACALAARGVARPVDIGVANGRPFLNAASVGLSSAVTRRISTELKRRLGRGAFAMVAASEAWTHRPFTVELSWERGTRRLEVHQVVVGNGRFHGGGQLVAPDASHADSLLNVYAITATRPVPEAWDEAPETRARLHDFWNLTRIALLLRRGRHLAHPAVVHLTTTQLRLWAEPAQEVDVDGELLGHTPVEFSLRPAALRVCVPGSAG